MLRTSKRAVSAGLPSVSHLPTSRRPWYLAAMASTWGAMVRQGGHHTAVKSTSTGTGDASVASTLWSFTSMTWLMIGKVAGRPAITGKNPGNDRRPRHLPPQRARYDWESQHEVASCHPRRHRPGGLLGLGGAPGARAPRAAGRHRPPRGPHPRGRLRRRPGGAAHLHHLARGPAAGGRA